MEPSTCTISLHKDHLFFFLMFFFLCVYNKLNNNNTLVIVCTCIEKQMLFINLKIIILKSWIQCQTSRNTIHIVIIIFKEIITTSTRITSSKG